jgi:hypothetical protein
MGWNCASLCVPLWQCGVCSIVVVTRRRNVAFLSSKLTISDDEMATLAPDSNLTLVNLWHFYS